MSAADEAAVLAFPTLGGLIAIRESGWTFLFPRMLNGVPVRVDGHRNWPGGWLDAHPHAQRHRRDGPADPARSRYSVRPSVGPRLRAEAVGAVTAAPLDDRRARTVARYIASWLSLARALPNPERDDVCRALGAHSPTLRRWNFWSIWSTLLLVCGLVALGIGAAGLTLRDAVPWSRVATLFGAVALSWSEVVMWRLNHQATDVIVGLYLAVLPPDAQQLTIDSENRS